MKMGGVESGPGMQVDLNDRLLERIGLVMPASILCVLVRYVDVRNLRWTSTRRRVEIDRRIQTEAPGEGKYLAGPRSSKLRARSVAMLAG